jgi:hypothetical protein
MAEEVKKLENALGQVAQFTPKLTVEICRQFQQLTDPKERKAFYEAHPELRQLYSEGNFHVA